ncbi:YiiX/YebB-like N1pC/P60 family cysteine hydrolase [Desulfonatronum lacustre]|uniref:YiiX/YebB-like N1pC/P60 family cysteine hydrolase n=1 Tax=Desulfonatronum lacustre TaxID=66849 RepID=UPI0004B8A7D1|nr:YiiX/YebB-like N1pC/P60 family cysteine hydrolase [Desulfonatronum lacustre]
MYSLRTNIGTGDIVLIRGPAKHSKIISKVTKGHFSHAYLALGESQMIEAIGSGVQYTSCLRFAVEDKSNIAVLRPLFKDDSQAHEVRSNIRDIAKGHQSRGYDFIGAILAVLERKKTKKSEKYFCSQLVASIFREAGFPLFEKEDHLVTPNDFLRCSLLFDITNDSVGQVPDYLAKRKIKNGIRIPLLDKGGETTSENALLLRKLLKKSKNIFLQHGLKPPNKMYDLVDAITDPANLSFAAELDSKITKLYDELNINSHLASQCTGALGDMEELWKELNEYGQPFAIDEMKWIIDRLNLLKLRLTDLREYEHMYALVYETNKLSYACRQRDYYRIIIKNVIEVAADLNNRIDLIKKYLDEC